MLRADHTPDGRLGQGIQRAGRAGGGLADQSGREMDILDLVSLAQWSQTLWRIAEAPGSDQPTYAHPEATRIRTDGSAHAACLRAEISQGGIPAFTTGTKRRAIAVSNLCVGKMDMRSAWSGV